jgi:hypothetical protein
MKRVLPLFLLTAALAMAQEAPAQESGDPLLMWKWINFAILAVALGWLMAKTLPAVFKSRTASIQKGIAEAQQQKKGSAHERSGHGDRVFPRAIPPGDGKGGRADPR